MVATSTRSTSVVDGPEPAIVIIGYAQDLKARGAPCMKSLKLEPLRELRQPPLRRLLDEMRISPVWQVLACRSRVHRAEQNALCKRLKMVQNVVNALRLDMLQNVDAHHHLSRDRLSRVFRDAGVVRLVLELPCGVQVLSEREVMPAPVVKDVPYFH